MNTSQAKLRCSFISSSLSMLAATAVVALSSQVAAAQGSSTTLKGDVGLKSGSQAPPGLYITNVIYTYNTDTLVTNDGRKIEGNASINPVFYALAATFVSKKKILGGHYSASWVLPLANITIDSPRLDQSTGWGASDMYFQPLQLGWHTKYADFVAGYGIFVPTGRFTPGASDNNGLGQWAHEFTYGFTLYPNEKKSLHLATLASYDIHSKKRGTEQKVGDTLTLEGGIGGAFRKGLTNAGLAYYTQWKITEDRVPASLPAFRGKHRYIGLGPEFNNTWIVKERLPVVATLRYFFETGNRVATQGNAFIFALTFVLPAAP